MIKKNYVILSLKGKFHIILNHKELSVEKKGWWYLVYAVNAPKCLLLLDKYMQHSNTTFEKPWNPVICTLFVCII